MRLSSSVFHISTFYQNKYKNSQDMNSITKVALAGVGQRSSMSPSSPTHPLCDALPKTDIKLPCRPLATSAHPS